MTRILLRMLKTPVGGDRAVHLLSYRLLAEAILLPIVLQMACQEIHDT